MPLVTGNAAREGLANRGWFVGHFMPDGLSRTDAVEVKWGVHALDEERQSWAASTEATTLSVLVRGSIRIYFEDGVEALLCKPGDYALWPPGLAHRWRIEEDNTVIVTIRWPSRAGDVREH
jgi:cupin superfamily acireductone dioxygenase involved in methionine salvage